MSKLGLIKKVIAVSTLAYGISGAVYGKAIASKKASTFPATVKNPAPGEIIVKCAGIAKKGKNHCGANGHGCNGLSGKDANIKDFDKNEWIYVREEVCNATPGRIVGKKQVIKG